jgi:hypothetical protein
VSIASLLPESPTGKPTITTPGRAWEEAVEQAQRCTQCGEIQPHLRCCARCRKAWYCSKACQKKHWKEGGHKEQCKTAAA